MMQAEFIEKTIQSGRGKLTQDGALVVRTGACTGRSTKERFIVRRPAIESEVEWGAVNQAVEPAKADQFFEKLMAHLERNRAEKVTSVVGSFPIEVTSTSPWHLAFALNMFRRETVADLAAQVDNKHTIRIFHEPDLTPQELGIDWPFDRGIILDVQHMVVAIIGSGYAGEIKKSAFSMCNFLYPRHGIFPMHASANCDLNGQNSSVLFGLSGTGKTTLSADPNRFLIGDDEIVWSKSGLSNLEGGCYAKLINLDRFNEPDIYQASNRFGSILENVAFNDVSRVVDFASDKTTENTRGSYALSTLKNAFNQKREASHPKTIVFLTADAFGALPAVARLNGPQAQFHFLSGYTAKVAGTEIGVKEPTAAFSTCFGAPFMPRKPSEYAALLENLMSAHGTHVWLLNTGWTSGGYGKGPRFPIPVSRRLLTLIQSGELNSAKMVKHPVFGFEVPTKVDVTADAYLEIPRGLQVEQLATKFRDNAKKMRLHSSLIEESIIS